MTTADPETGARFDTDEMVDQVAIFFLAGHETSASALAWALYLLALYPDWQDRVAEEARGAGSTCRFCAAVASCGCSRDVFRETLRLYPPVPMMVREATQPERFRDRDVPKGAQTRAQPVASAPPRTALGRTRTSSTRRAGGPKTARPASATAYIPFSAGPRVCTGAGFAMVEGAAVAGDCLCAHFRFELVAGRDPVPVAHLTVRAKDGIWLRISRR